MVGAALPPSLYELDLGFHVCDQDTYVAMVRGYLAAVWHVIAIAYLVLVAVMVLDAWLLYRFFSKTDESHPASAAAYGQPTHLWIGATAGAFATACGTLSTLLLLTKDNP